MGEQHSGHQLSNAATASAHAAQKREWSQGTSATTERGCCRQTSAQLLGPAFVGALPIFSTPDRGSLVTMTIPDVQISAVGLFTV